MLGDVESRIAAIVGNGVVTRTHLKVVQPPQGAEQPAAGADFLRVSVSTIGPDRKFEREHFQLSSTEETPTQRRVVPVAISAKLEFRLHPVLPDTGNAGPALLAARTLLLEDISAVAHLLSANNIRTGDAFAPAAGDPGFRIRSFELVNGQVVPELVDDLLSGRLEYEVGVEIWPSVSAEELGRIDAVDSLILPQPYPITTDRPAVPVGETARIRIVGISQQRLAQVDAGTREPVDLAVRVASDLPLDQRGSIEGGRTGAETGLRIFASSSPETVVTYRAPTGDIGSTRTEYVTVHLATPEDGAGALLGSVALRLIPEVS